jgi:hypothetical protein
MIQMTRPVAASAKWPKISAGGKRLAPACACRGPPRAILYILTQGGPAGATELISTLLYKQAFSLNEAGYAAAMGVGMTSVVLVVVGVFLWLRRRGWEV